MSQEKFRVIIVGAGAIARVAHVPAAIASPWVELVGIVDPDTNRARSLCADYGLDIAVTGDLNNMVESFDGAVIATPNDLHASVAIELLQNDIPVLVEKPLATTVDEAEAVVSAARRHGKVCAVGYHTRHSGACQSLRYAVTSGHFGETVAFAHQDGSRGGWSPLSGYNLDVKRAGGGVLVSTGTHFLDRILWLWGTPSSVDLRDNAGGGPESHCIARFSYESSTAFSGSAFFSKLVGLPENTVVETTEGHLIMASDAAESVLFRPRKDQALEYAVRKRAGDPDPRGLYQRQLEDFALACLNNTEPGVNAEAGVESVRLATRLYAARRPIDGECRDGVI